MFGGGRSEEDFFGTIHHYDEDGKEIGRSEPGIFGGYTNYDNDGDKIGYSEPGIFGGYNHYDDGGHKIGHSDPTFFGGYTHEDENGRPMGSSDPGMFGTYHHNSNQGCYVATCVYGSYDCPEVWTLRRFRDNSLARTWAGRAFIHTYYAISPTIVKWFGESKWFKNMWHGVLDNMVQRLRDEGVEDTPYNDREW